MSDIDWHVVLAVGQLLFFIVMLAFFLGVQYGQSISRPPNSNI